jgi:hypothetical protein
LYKKINFIINARRKTEIMQKYSDFSAIIEKEYDLFLCWVVFRRNHEKIGVFV